MERGYFIGLDVGTTSTKAVVYAPDGRIKSMAIIPYPLLMPRPGWAEQEPDVIFQAVLKALQSAVRQAELKPNEIIAIGFSTAMHTLIAVDRTGAPLTNSMTWADSRSVKQAERLKQSEQGRQIYRRTGTPVHPMSPLTKLIWMREEDPHTFQRAAKFVSIKEYVLHKLFQTYVVDHSIASATGLFDVERLDWHEPALAAAGITSDKLSEPVPTTHTLVGMERSYAEWIGIRPDTPFVVGASDGVLANLGVGAVKPGQTAVTIGTSGAVRSVVDRPLTDERGRTFCYVLTDGKWVIGGPTNNGGIALRWFRDQFAQQEKAEAERLGSEVYDVLLAIAERVPPGADGLLFLPYLTGERAPHWDSDARGSFFGVGLHHKREHFLRAVLEGITFGVYHVELALRDLAGPSREILASGGFARSAVWRQIMADVFGCGLKVPQTPESSSFGAALLAMHAVGELGRLEDAVERIAVSHRHHPNLENHSVYQELFAVYERVYAQCAREFAAMAEFQRKRVKSSVQLN